MKYQQLVLEEIAGNEYPSIILEDNNGAIFLVGNKQVNQRTKHIDVKHHFIREFKNQNRGIVLRVDTKENYADLLTKNVDGQGFKYLGKDVKNGFVRFRKKMYDDGFIKQHVGGVSGYVNNEHIDDERPSLVGIESDGVIKGVEGK